MASAAGVATVAGCQALNGSDEEDGVEYLFFSPYQARVVTSVANRIVPGNDDEPSAEEAGVIRFIDRALVREPEYTTGHDDRLYQDAYNDGIRRLDRTADELYDTSVPDLDTDELDSLLEQVQAREAPGWEDVPAFNPVTMTIAEDDFFTIFRDHVIEGYYAWPKYGGNRNLDAWRAVGYTGPFLEGYQSDELKPPWQSFDEVEEAKTRPEHFQEGNLDSVRNPLGGDRT